MKNKKFLEKINAIDFPSFLATQAIKRAKHLAAVKDYQRRDRLGLITPEERQPHNTRYKIYRDQMV